jgi:hypothetical protein
MTEFDPERRLNQIKTEIFRKVAAKLLAGDYYPPKNVQPAEYVRLLPELGDLAVCSTIALTIREKFM